MNLIRTLILSLIVTYSSFGQSVVQIPNSIGGEQNSLGISEEYVAFSKDVDGKIELYLWNIDENITTRLTNNNYFDCSPIILDGYVYWTREDGPGTEIVKYHIGTSAESVITSNNVSTACETKLKSGSGFLTWSGDAQIEVYDLGTSNHYIVDNGGGNIVIPRIRNSQNEIAYIRIDYGIASELIVHDVMSGVSDTLITKPHPSYDIDISTMSNDKLVYSVRDSVFNRDYHAYDLNDGTDSIFSTEYIEILDITGNDILYLAEHAGFINGYKLLKLNLNTLDTTVITYGYHNALSNSKLQPDGIVYLDYFTQDLMYYSNDLQTITRITNNDPSQIEYVKGFKTGHVVWRVYAEQWGLYHWNPNLIAVVHEEQKKSVSIDEFADSFRFIIPSHDLPRQSEVRFFDSLGKLVHQESILLEQTFYVNKPVNLSVGVYYVIIDQLPLSRVKFVSY